MHTFCQKAALKKLDNFCFNAHFQEKSRLEIDFNNFLLFQNNFFRGNFTDTRQFITRFYEIPEIVS